MGSIKNTWLVDIVGSGFNEEMDTKVAEHIGKNYVSKSDFNSKNTMLEQANATIATYEQQMKELKKVNPEELQQRLKEMQEVQKTEQLKHAEQLKASNMRNAIDRALYERNAVDVTAVGALLDHDKLVYDENTKQVAGLKEQLDALEKEKAWAFAPAGKPSTSHTPSRSIPNASGDVDADYAAAVDHMNSLLRDAVGATITVIGEE